MAAQNKKEPLRPFSSLSTIYDSCQVVCNLFPSNRDNLVSTERLVFTGIVDNQECYNVPEGFNPGCLLSYNNSKWFLVKVLEGDTLRFQFSNSKNHDIDAAIWGPISQGNLDSTCHVTTKFPTSCDYSSIDPFLTLHNPSLGSYYVLAITNYSNDSTDILLSQPSGGKVTYSYFCSENATLKSKVSGNQNIQAITNLKLSFEINSSSFITAKGGSSIELLPGFQTDSLTVFNASIGECINTSQNYNPDSSTIECEDYSNHKKNIPHLYSNATSNELVGTVFSKTQPEYMAYDNIYKKMTKIGVDKDSSRFLWGFREPYIADANIHLRTKSGCPIIPDTRITHKEPTFRDDHPLTTLPPVNNYFNLNSPFYVASHMPYGAEVFDLWNTYLRGDSLPSFMYRINGGGWEAWEESSPIWEDFSERLLNVTKIVHVRVPKDFIMDFSPDFGETIDRYVVTRNSCGGHFGGTTVFNRVADSTVIVSVYQGDINVDMQLGSYNSYGGFGSCFNLGKMADGTYTYPLKSVKGDFILDEEIFVRVKFQ